MRNQQRDGLAGGILLVFHAILLLCAPNCSCLPCHGQQNNLRPPIRGGNDSAAANQLQSFGGAALIFAVERSIWAFGKYIRRPIPSAPFGMMLVFIVLVASNAVAPQLTADVANWFAPSIAQLLKLVPLFFSPPLVQLPLALAPLRPPVILKMLAIVGSGSLVGVAATGITVQLIWGFRGGKTHPSSSPSATGTTLTSSAATLGQQEQISPNRMNWIAMAGGVLGVCAAVASGWVSVDAVLIIGISAASLECGDRMPAGLKRFLPSIITSSALTCAGVLLLGKWRGQPPLEALGAYRSASGGVFGGSGVGDWLFACAPAVIVALGFRLFEQRRLLARHLAPLLGGSALNCLLSLAFTLAASRLLRIPPEVGRSLVPRFISLPFAVPLAAALQGTAPLAALATCIQGPIASAFGFRLLDACGVRSTLARGLAIGGSAHALGTATAAGLPSSMMTAVHAWTQVLTCGGMMLWAGSAAEPGIAAAAALAFMLSGSFMSVFFLPTCANALNALFEH